MAKVDPELVKEMSEFGMKKKQLKDGSVIHAGPWLKEKNGEPVWYDSYTEALYANISEKRKMDLAKEGLNENGQTKQQEADFKKRMEISKKNKEKAAVILQATEQLK